MNRWLVRVVGLLWCGLAHAGERLSYQQALMAALDANPALRQSAFSVDAAKGSKLSSQGLFDPELRVSGTYSRQSARVLLGPTSYSVIGNDYQAEAELVGDLPTGTSYSIGGSYSLLDQDFEDGTSRKTTSPTLVLDIKQNLLKGILFSYNEQNIRKSKLSLTSSNLELDQQRQTVLADTASAYVEWAYRERLHAIALEAVAASNEALRVTALKVREGELAPADESRLETQVIQDKTAVLDARQDADDALDALLVLIGKEPGTPYTLGERTKTLRYPTIDPAIAVQVALDHNLDIQVAKQDIAKAELDYKSAKHAVLPTLQAGLNYRLSEQSITDATGQTDDPNTDITVSATFSVPLAQRVAVGERRTAEAGLYRSKAALEELEQSIRRQVLAQVRVVDNAEARIQLAEANLALTQQTLDSQLALYRAGRVILKDVLEDRATVETAKAEATKARYDYLLARVALSRLQGILTIDDLY